MSDTGQPLGWGGIVRLGLVQTALGSIVVLTTSTLNRVMIVELALPALLALAAAGFVGPEWPLRVSVFLLGMALGTFAVAAIWSMMGLVNAGRAKREGVRMGLWGAAQATAFGLGGLLGTAAIDLTRYLFESPAISYATVFTAEALLFLAAGALATRITTGRGQPLRMPLAVDGDGPLHSMNQAGMNQASMNRG